jgi:hypothetical protein
MLGFQESKSKNNIVLEKRWPRNDIDVDDDPCQTLALAYNRKMDQLVMANTLNNEVDEEDIPRLDDEEKTLLEKWFFLLENPIKNYPI